jgi:hypothetical protein
MPATGRTRGPVGFINLLSTGSAGWGGSGAGCWHPPTSSKPALKSMTITTSASSRITRINNSPFAVLCKIYHKHRKNQQ